MLNNYVVRLARSVAFIGGEERTSIGRHCQGCKNSHAQSHRQFHHPLSRQAGIFNVNTCIL